MQSTSAKEVRPSGLTMGVLVAIASTLLGYGLRGVEATTTNTDEVKTVQRDVDTLKQQQSNYRPADELVSKDRFDATVSPMQADIKDIKDKQDKAAVDIGEIKAILKGRK